MSALVVAMDKGRKLRRYSRKDYTQLVELPVEIVGRDGVVRRYSFEESVRLYQRRIESAGMRYEDGDIVKAEVHHCRRRIEQLRKSYFARYGWDALRTPGSGRLDGELAGEVAAFLRRCLTDSSGEEVGGVALSFLAEADHHRLYFVQGEGGVLAGGSALLYVHRFESGVTSCPAREAFFSWLKVLQSVQPGGAGVEDLVAFHHTADCGLTLTCPAQGAGERRAPPQPADRGSPDWVDLQGDDNDPLRRAMLCLRKGREADALELLEEAYEQHPFRRAAYTAAVVVADQLGEHARGQTAALMGSRYFPDDTLLKWHLAVASLRMGDIERAEALSHDLDQQEEGVGARALLRGLLHVRAGRLAAGRRALVETLREVPPDSDLDQSARLVLRQLATSSLTRLSGVAVAVAGGFGMNSGRMWAAALIVLGLGLLPLTRAASLRRLRALLQASAADGLRLATPGALRSRAEDEADCEPDPSDAPSG